MENAGWRDLLDTAVGGETLDDIVAVTGPPALSFGIGLAIGAVDAAHGTYPVYSCLLPAADLWWGHLGTDTLYYGLGAAVPLLLTYF